VIVAHGTGPGHDLPVPLFYAVAGGALAVFLTFVAASLLYPESRLRGCAAGRAVPVAVERIVDAAGTRWTLRCLALAFTAAVVVDAVRLPDDPHDNPAASVVYAVFWVGLVVTSMMFGPVWRMLNPLRTLHLVAARLSGRDPADGRWSLPKGVGYWPAAIGLAAFVWMELVSPEPDSTRTLLWFFGVYAVVHLAGASVFGSRWFDRGDAFEVFSDLIGRLAPLGRRSDRRLVIRSPLNGLDTVSPASGLVVVVCVILASTAYDSIIALWDYGSVAAGTVGLAVAIGLVLAFYGLASAVTAVIGRHRGVAGLFVHALIPIAVGYLVAHYLPLLVGESQRAAVLLLRLEWSINETPVPAGVMAVVQVGAIIGGHVLGVIAAHDRAVRLFEPRAAVTGQVPMMGLMVMVTIGGLALLAAG
jgi:hypothetical protein